MALLIVTDRKILLKYAIKAFLAKGGVIQEGRKPRARKGSKMTAKSTRFVSGTSGFANGFPRKSTGAL